MKSIFITISIFLAAFSSCENDENQNATVTLNFTHNWDGVSITNQDFNDIKFTNANGEDVSIERLRYLISNISLVDSKNYTLVDVEEDFGNSFIVNNLEPGNYNLSFTFGFTDTDNQDGIYQDLNTANFNVPEMLGGGYHYMQFDGKYLNLNNQEAPFNYHAIKAVDTTDPNNLIFEDTSISVNLGAITVSNNTEIEIKMDVSEWFKNPNTWDLNQLNTVLMPNFNAQKRINANGESVFTLGEVTNN